MRTDDLDRPLRVCLLSYRSNPHCGGQGVYLRHLAQGLHELGHHVEVISGPPQPELGNGFKVHYLPSLDLYNPLDPFRIPWTSELRDPVNALEWGMSAAMAFPEPLTFGFRAWRHLSEHHGDYDIVHDNQCLAYGLLGISRLVPTTATIHHPITVDFEVDYRTAPTAWQKFKFMRWYSFLAMQKRVARRLSPLITVSECARHDIARDFKVREDSFRVVPNGIDTDNFRPVPGVEREPGRLIVTNSADTPLKGLRYLLHAVAKVSRRRDIKLVVIGTPRENGEVEKLVRRLGIRHLITFTGRISDEEFRRQYARASMAVVPSVYEGFGLPAGEAMACGVPVISSRGGALPEVVGDAGLLVPCEDADALAKAITELIDNPERARRMGMAGYQRVHSEFTWKKAAEKTAEAYRETICDYRRLRQA